LDVVFLLVGREVVFLLLVRLDELLHNLEDPVEIGLDSGKNVFDLALDKDPAHEPETSALRIHRLDRVDDKSFPQGVRLRTIYNN
jgi:hypothetical protein